MSREHWFSLGCQQERHPSGDWRETFSHRPLKGRTTDPEALNYDKASELFFEGMKLARRGDLKTGGSRIAAAYLLDGRAINFRLFLPDPAAADMVLDIELLHELIIGNTYAATILRVALAQYLGDTPSGQTFIAEAIHSIDDLLKEFKRKSKVEAPTKGGDIPGGRMARKTLLFHRSVMYMGLGNQRKGIKDLTRALEVDPGYTRARCARACLWASTNTKEPAVIHAEYKRIVSEVHEDNEGLDVVYAWLCFYTLDDARLGTVQDAKGYYEKMIRAQAKREELYGHRVSLNEAPILQVTKDKFKSFATGPPEVRQFREDCDALVLSGKMEGLEIPERKTDMNLLHRCLKCNKTAVDIGSKLSKCGRCKKVSYCSRDCQTADWKSHKDFCEAAVMPKPPPQAAPEAKKGASEGRGKDSLK